MLGDSFYLNTSHKTAQILENLQWQESNLLTPNA